jgi:hypothetical protein
VRRARVALAAAAAAGLLIWPGMVALRAMPVVDAEAPVTSPPGGAITSSTVAVDRAGDTVSGLLDDLRPGGARTDAGGAAAAPQSATVRAAIGPVQRPPATAPAGRHAEPRGVQAVLAAAYEQAARSVPRSCHLRPEYLAAIGQIESGSLGGRQLVGHRVVPAVLGPLLDGGPFAVVRDTDGGRYDGSAQYDRAVGPMQFLPGTWAWAGRDGDADGRRDPQNVVDASFATAAYLCRGGRNLSREAALRDAFWSYNQSADYVSAALAWVSYFERNGLGALDAVAVRVASGGRASDLGPAPAAVSATARPLSPAAAARTAPTTAAPTASVPTPVTTTPSTTPPTKPPTLPPPPSTTSATSPPTTTTTSPTSSSPPTPPTTPTDSPTAPVTTTSATTATTTTANTVTTTTAPPTTPVQTP